MTRRVLIESIVLLVAAIAHGSCDMINSEGIYELKLVSKWVQYLSEHHIKDQDGNLLQERYFVDSNGVSHSSELSRESEDSFEDLKKLAGWQNGNDVINATALRYDSNTTDNDQTKVWARIARDMLWAIHGTKLEGNGSKLLVSFRRHVFNPWQDVIYARYNSILRVDRQSAFHLAILKAHQDFFALVRQRMLERLPPEMARFLPRVDRWPEPHKRLQLDHINWELKALKKYCDLRKSLESELSLEELNSVIEILPVKIREAVYLSEVDPQTDDLLEEIGDEREIGVKRLVKLNENRKMGDGNCLRSDAEDGCSESRRSVWRAIHQGLRVLGRHIIQPIDPQNLTSSDQSKLNTLKAILLSLKEAVMQRVYILNGMIDSEINRNLITNFHLQRDNLNELFDQLSGDLSQEKLPIWFDLLGHLDLAGEANETQINRFHLRVEYESLRTDAEQLFSQAMDQLAGVNSELKQAAESLKSVALQAIDRYEGDEIRQRLMQAFDKLKQECAKLVAHEENLGNDSDKLPQRRQAGQNLRDFFTYVSAYTTRTGDQRLVNLVADMIEGARGLL